MSQRILSNLKILALALIIGLATSAVYAWSGPTAPPPGGNKPAPINVSSAEQTKEGFLRLAGIRTTAASYINFPAAADLAATKGAPFKALTLAVNGSVGATQYCDQDGNNCVTTLGGATSTSSGGGSTAPSFNSGWFVISKDKANQIYTPKAHYCVTKTFSDLGSVDNLVVDLQFKGKDQGGSGGSDNIHDRGIGSVSGGNEWDGAWYSHLTSNSVVVCRGRDDVFVDQVRVRIWKY